MFLKWIEKILILVITLITPSFVLVYGMDEIQESDVTIKILGRQWII